MNEETKDKIFHDFCIISVILLLSGFFVGGVKADITDYEFDSEGHISFEKVTSADESYSDWSDGHDYVSYFTSLEFVDIGYYDNILYISLLAHDFSKDGTYNAMQTDFTSSIGYGSIGYTYNAVTEKYTVWLYFENFDKGSLTGAQSIALNYNRVYVGNMQSTHTGNIDAAGSKAIGYDTGSPVDNWVAGDYYVQYGGVWENDIDVIFLSGFVNKLEITKFSKLSKWKVWTNTTEYINDTTFNTNNFNLTVFEIPIYINVTDVWSNYHTATFIGFPAENRLFGYVYDTKGNFTLENVFLEFQTDNTTSSSTGYYNFNNDTFGTFYINASLSGYQNYNQTIDYTGEQRHDIYLTKNETVYSGTTTVAGKATDATTGANINNVVVKIFNSTYSTYTYTSDTGYYVFYNLTNTTYSLSAEKSGYIKQQQSINLTTLNVSYYYNFELLATEDVEEEPTPIPTPPRTLPEHIGNIFDLLGVEDWGVIIALAIIVLIGGLFGAWSGGNPLLILFGGFFGFLVSVYMGLLPAWMLALVILITVLFIVGMVVRQYNT